MKMKKLLMFICAVMLVFGMVGSASAISFTDEYINSSLEGMAGSDSGTYEWIWEHDTPGDFWGSSVLESAILEITVTYDEIVVKKGEYEYKEFEVEKTIMGLLGDDGRTLTWDYTGEIFGVSGTWDAGDVLGVELIISDSDIDNFTFYSSKFDLQYDHAPEPSTILLMGSGLLGLVGYGRKRFSKKS